MYADDLVVYIACSDDEAEPLLEDIVHALRTFGLHTGLRMKVSKSKVLLNRLKVKLFVLSLGLKLADKIRYFGVMIGHGTQKDIFASAISNSFLRAQTIRDMDMTGTEKVQLLTAWVYPLWIVPARVCYPSKQIVRQMCTMLQTALRLDSLILTLQSLVILAVVGLLSYFPKKFVLFHPASLFLHFFWESSPLRPTMCGGMRAMCTVCGVASGPTTLTYVTARLGTLGFP